MKLIPIILVAASFSASAVAQPNEDERRRESISLANVRFEDPQSVASLRRKISAAVQRVCMPDGIRSDPSVQVRMCRMEAQQRADRQLAQIMSQTKLAALVR